jgi:hypothetical protein
VIVEKMLREILGVIQQDVGSRGLAKDPVANLFNACPDDFVEACRSLADHQSAALGVVTGFWIPSTKCGETDGPLGAVYLARTLPELGIPTILFSDPFCRFALEAGLELSGRQSVRNLVWHVPELHGEIAPWWEAFKNLTHLLSIERVGRCHHPSSLTSQHPIASIHNPEHAFEAEVPPLGRWRRCYNMRGVDITDAIRDASALFESRMEGVVTIGVGDGGNEIGMGKIPWKVIHDNIPNGGRIACGVATDHLIVAGISNWGAYALASGVALMKDVTPPAGWFDTDREQHILREMVEKGPLVDGVTGRFVDQVDGLPFDEYIKPLRQIERIVRH